MEELLTIQDLRTWAPRPGAGRGRRKVIDGVDLRIDEGEKLVLLGNGESGKSVLLRSVTRLVEGGRYAGKVHLRGFEHNLLKCRRGRLRRVRGGQIGYLPGDSRTILHPASVVRDQFIDLLKWHRPEVHDVREEMTYWFHEAGIAAPEARMRMRASELDPVSRIRVGVAMAFCTFPRVLLADEPTEDLDACSQAEILALIEKLLAKSGIGMIYATRDFRVAMRVAERAAVLRRGRIVEEGEVAGMIKAPAHEATAALLEAVPRGHLG